MSKKPKRSKKATKISNRSKIASKPVVKRKVRTISARVDASTATSAPKITIPSATRSSSARASIAEGTRLYALAGRPTKADFIKVYGPNGPRLTWAQRAAAGVDAKHFQAALAAKGGA